MTESTKVVALARTGELVTVESAETEALAETLLMVRERQDELRTMRKWMEDELRDRLKQAGRKQLARGDFEVHLHGGRESVWDADELESALDELIGAGVLVASEVTDVITRETKVNRKLANDLVKRLDGQYAARLSEARTWKDGRSMIEVVPSVALPDPQNPALRAVP